MTEVKDGSIIFDHVNFSYKKGSGEYVLKDINLNIHAGETIGIIGGTGSAKSSLVNLISRLYDVTTGKYQSRRYGCAGIMIWRLCEIR